MPTPIDDAVVIRIRRTTDASKYDIQVGFTPGMETTARDALSRMFGMHLPQTYFSDETRREYVDIVMREMVPGLVESTKGVV